MCCEEPTFRHVSLKSQCYELQRARLHVQLCVVRQNWGHFEMSLLPLVPYNLWHYEPLHGRVHTLAWLYIGGKAMLGTPNSFSFTFLYTLQHHVTFSQGGCGARDIKLSFTYLYNLEVIDLLQQSKASYIQRYEIRSMELRRKSLLFPSRFSTMFETMRALSTRFGRHVT